MKRALGLGALALLLTLAGVAPAPGATRVAGLQEPEPAIEVGAGPLREPALAFVGRNEYRADVVSLYGYFSAVIGLERSLVFTDPDAPSEATARFTYAGEASLSGPPADGAATTVGGTGTLTVYLEEGGGADFADPASFADGVAIARFDVRLLDTIDARSADAGVVVGEEELTQTAAVAFSLAGERYRFGHVGVRQHMLFTGTDVGADPDDNTLVVVVAGSTVVIDRELVPPTAEATAATATAGPSPTPAEAGDCTGVEPWLAEARQRLERLAAIGAEIPGDATPGSVDAEALRELATEVAGLATDQREVEAPGAGLAANRLLVTALSTYARGLGLLANAAEAGDESAFAQAREVVADGEELAARALIQLEQVAAACGV